MVSIYFRTVLTSIIGQLPEDIETVHNNRPISWLGILYDSQLATIECSPININVAIRIYQDQINVVGRIVVPAAVPGEFECRLAHAGGDRKRKGLLLSLGNLSI